MTQNMMVTIWRAHRAEADLSASIEDYADIAAAADSYTAGTSYYDDYDYNPFDDPAQQPAGGEQAETSLCQKPRSDDLVGFRIPVENDQIRAVTDLLTSNPQGLGNPSAAAASATAVTIEPAAFPAGSQPILGTMANGCTRMTRSSPSSTRWLTTPKRLGVLLTPP